jgi:hypothetical protein
MGPNRPMPRNSSRIGGGENPPGAKVLPMSPEYSVNHVSGMDPTIHGAPGRTRTSDARFRKLCAGVLSGSEFVLGMPNVAKRGKPVSWLVLREATNEATTLACSRSPGPDGWGSSNCAQRLPIATGASRGRSSALATAPDRASGSGPSLCRALRAQGAPREGGPNQGRELAAEREVVVGAALGLRPARTPLVGAREINRRVDPANGGLRAVAGLLLRGIVERSELLDRRQPPFPIARPGAERPTVFLGFAPRELAAGVARSPRKPGLCVAHDLRCEPVREPPEPGLRGIVPRRTRQGATEQEPDQRPDRAGTESQRWPALSGMPPARARSEGTRLA